MHCACFTPWSAVAVAFVPDAPAFESPEPPHPAAVRARAAAEAASNTEALFIVSLPEGYRLRGSFLRSAGDHGLLLFRDHFPKPGHHALGTDCCGPCLH